jgi:Protein of unknown function (DUF2934)
MSGPTEGDVRKRAYELWKAAGEPEGQADAFWYQAEKELHRNEPEPGQLPPGMTDNLPV